MSIFKKPSFKSESKKRDMPEGLWQKCPDCGEVVHQLTLVENLHVCPKCDYHFTIEAWERLEAFLDAGTFEEFDADLQPTDVLSFRGPKAYRESLDKYQKLTGMPDAVISGTGKSEGRQLAVAAMDFRFLAASMGSVVGEKITRVIEYGTEHGLPVIVFTAAGGARVHEGLFGLMQMAKTSGALARHARAGLPYIPVLTNPTTGGVSASFATLGDLILAEPKCMVGFAGPRVIRETTHQDLPPGFQTAEFLEDHGLVDMIVHRKKMRSTVAEDPQLPFTPSVNYRDALAWLYGTQDRGIKLGLDRVRTFLTDLGWEAGGQRFLHVAGTNGKGSVCAMLDSICRAAGMRTGLYTSPHLITFRERIRLNGEMAATEEIAEELTRIRAVCEQTGTQATFFEITTALALGIFRHGGTDIIVLETGLGGRLDATNVVRPEVAVITSVGMDHTQILGATLREIAREKAGIIKPGVPIVTGPLKQEAAEAVAEVAAERGARLIKVTEPVRDLPVGLTGAHQRINAAVALRALEAAGIAITLEQAAAGLRSIDWPARFQDTGKGFILDGAHNPQAARRLVETWRSEYGARRTEVILGVVRDKDARGICAELAAVAERFTIVPVRSPRAGPVDELVEIAKAWRPCRACNSLDEAIATTPRGETPAMITGSLFLMGEALVLLGLAEGEQEISAQ